MRQLQKKPEGHRKPKPSTKGVELESAVGKRDFEEQIAQQAVQRIESFKQRGVSYTVVVNGEIIRYSASGAQVLGRLSKPEKKFVVPPGVALLKP